MHISTAQLAAYLRDGYLFIPGAFSTEEIHRIRDALPLVLTEDSRRRVLEKDGRTVRSVYGAHTTNTTFRRLVRDARMLDVARCILGSEVYIYQFKVNSKAAFSGDVWAWHQDFIFWLREDGVPAPLLTTAILFLEEVNEFNGPLMLIPGSHAGGVIDVPARPDAVQEGRDWVANLTADINYALPMNVVSSLVERFGIIAPKGPAGSVLFFHPNVVHGSTLNISPFSRALALVTYCDIANRPAEMDTPRPEFLCARDFTVVSGDEV